MVEGLAKVYANAGAITKGMDPVTLDGFAMERVENIITDIPHILLVFEAFLRSRAVTL